MTPRISDPDPERSLVYLKEKLDCACESFDGSATYNLQLARWLRFVTAASCMVSCVCVTSRFLSDDRHIVYIANILTLAAGVLVGLMMLLDRYRNYSTCYLAHAHAAIRMMQIEKKIAFLEQAGGPVLKKDVEGFYDEYRSVYDDTRLTLHSKRKMVVLGDLLQTTKLSELRRQPPLALRPAGWETRRV